MRSRRAGMTEAEVVRGGCSGADSGCGAAAAAAVSPPLQPAMEVTGPPARLGGEGARSRGGWGGGVRYRRGRVTLGWGGGGSARQPPSRPPPPSPRVARRQRPLSGRLSARGRGGKRRSPIADRLRPRRRGCCPGAGVAAGVAREPLLSPAPPPRLLPACPSVPPNPLRPCELQCRLLEGGDVVLVGGREGGGMSAGADSRNAQMTYSEGVGWLTL